MTCFSQCLESDELLHVYHIDKNKTVSQKDFLNLCPSLVLMLDKGSCDPHKEEETPKTKLSVVDIPPKGIVDNSMVYINII